MTAETIAKVEALYASGVVERPKWGDAELHFTAHGWVWLSVLDDGTPFGWCGDIQSPEPVIGWSMVLACWAKRWLIVPATQRFIVAEASEHGDPIASDPDPIAAMLAALNGGG